MPNLLYIDTSASTATVALSAHGSIKAILTHENAHEQAAVLNQMIATVLSRASCTLSDVDALCVCAGPGSYTGLRVGLSTAKGLAYVKDIPLMLFNRLDLLAWAQTEEHPFAITLKARAGEYFFATYTSEGEQLTTPQHIFEQELTPFAAQQILFITDDEELNTSNKKMITSDTAIPMDSWIPKAEACFERKQFDNLAYSEPFYLKGAYTTQSKK
jgi:tRNA threonylcarbamoyladenosine biosynthesis protein TsaB